MKYADDQDAFFKDYAEAHLKLSELGEYKLLMKCGSSSSGGYDLCSPWIQCQSWLTYCLSYPSLAHGRHIHAYTLINLAL